MEKKGSLFFRAGGKENHLKTARLPVEKWPSQYKKGIGTFNTKEKKTSSTSQEKGGLGKKKYHRGPPPRKSEGNQKEN